VFTLAGMTQDPADDWLKPARFGLLLALLIAGLYPDVVVGLRTFVFRDFGLYSYPLAFYHRESFWRGEIPLWNPLSHCGLPFLAQWNTLVLYPLSAVYLLLPLSWALGLFNLAHLLLAGLGMYFLGYRWTSNRLAAAGAGVAFAFNGFTLNSLIWPHYLAALGWMPWVVWLGERAWREGRGAVVAAALVGAVQMLTGGPEIIVVTWVLLGLLALAELVRGRLARQRLLWRLALVVALVTGLSAAQLLPFLELLRHSQRGTEYAEGDWSMPWSGWANLLVPLFRCHPSSSGVYFQAGQGLTSSYYLGSGVLALAVLAVCRLRAWRVWLSAVLISVCLGLATGRHTPLWDWARAVFPPLGYMRYPIKFVIPVVFLVPLLAAVALARWQAAEGHEAARWRRTALQVGTVLGIVTLGIIGLAVLRPAPDERSITTVFNGATRLLFLGAILGCGGLLMRSRQGARAPAAPPAGSDRVELGGGSRRACLLSLGLLTLLWLDVATHAPRQNPTVEAAVYAPGLAPLHQLKPQPALGESRALLRLDAILTLRSKFLTNAFAAYLCHRLSLYDNCNLLDGIPKVDGFFPLCLRQEEAVRSQLYPTPAAFRTNLAEFLSVSQVTAEGDPLQFTARSGFAPLATAGQRPVFVAEAQSVSALLDPAWDPRAVVFLPPEAKPLILVTNQTQAQVRVVRFTAHCIELEVEASARSLVVVSQAFYPAWRASVDGRETPILRANHAFQALQVPAGRSHVKLVYRDRWFQTGAVVSLTTLLGCAVMGWRRRPGPDRRAATALERSLGGEVAGVGEPPTTDQR
jgi:hypothetical protein